MNIWGPFTNFTAFPLPLTAYFHKRFSGPALAQNPKTESAPGPESARAVPTEPTGPHQRARPGRRLRPAVFGTAVVCPARVLLRLGCARARAQVSCTATALWQLHVGLLFSRDFVRGLAQHGQPAGRQDKRKQVLTQAGVHPSSAVNVARAQGPELWLKCSRKRQSPCDSLAICSKIPILRS